MFKKNNKTKNSLLRNSSVRKSSKWQNKLDHKLVYKLRAKKTPSWRQLGKLPQVLSRKEKNILWSFVFLLIISASLWSWRFYQSHLFIFPTSGGEYTEGLIGTPTYINPILQTADVERDLSSLIFSGLLKRNKKQQLVADLTERYEISEDQLIYIFKLRKDVKWQDGEPFTANDVIFTIESIQNPEYKSPLFISFSGVTVETIDDYTIKFTLEEPYAPFLNILTVGILPEHLWLNVEPSNANLSAYNLEPIGTGAWKFDKIIKDKIEGSIKSIELVKSKDYYNTIPYLDKLIFKFYPDSIQSIEALKNKNIEGLGFVSKENKKQITKLKQVNPQTLSLPQHTTIFFNQTNNKTLRDINVRQALALSTNKNTLIKEVLFSEGNPIYGPILPGYIGYNPNMEKYELDINKANELLDKQWKRIEPQEIIDIRSKELTKKMEEVDKQIIKKQEEIQEKETSEDTEITENNTSTEESLITDLAIPSLEELETKKENIAKNLENLGKLKEQEFYRKKGDQILKIKLTTIDKPENSTAIELIKKMWSKIGVEVEIEIISKSRLQKDVIKPRNYETLLLAEVVGFDPDPYPFWHSSQNQDPGLNLSGFSNKEVDKLLEEARKINDEEIRNEKYIKFQDILAKEIPAIFLYSTTYTYPISTKIKNFDISRISIPADRFNNIEEWYVKTKGEFKWKK